MHQRCFFGDVINLRIQNASQVVQDISLILASRAVLSMVVTAIGQRHDINLQILVATLS